MYEFELDADIEAADPSGINRFGFFATLHALCNGNPMMYNEMLERPSIDIYTTLILNREIDEFNKRYSTIIAAKPKV